MLRLFKSVVLSALLYGSESWAPIVIQARHLQGFIMTCVQIIPGLTRLDQKRNMELRELAGLEREEIRSLRWLGDVAWMEETRTPRSDCVQASWRQALNVKS